MVSSTVARLNPPHRMRHAWLEQLLADVKFSVRSLCRARGFSLTVLFTLILGIGVTTGVYELTSWIIFNKSPYPDVEQLYVIGFKDKTGQSSYYRPGFFLRLYQEQTTVFSDFAAVEHPTANVVIDGQPVAERAANISEHTFPMLDIHPNVGRTFLPGEFKAGANNVVVLNYRFWRKYYNLDPGALGKTILINHDPCVIVGVLSKWANLPSYFYGDLYRPLALRNDPKNVFDQEMNVIGRAKPGVTREQASAALALLKLPPLPKWADNYFDGQVTTLSKLTEMNRIDSWWVMLAAGLFLYAIACLNATNLMLIRLLDRRRELSIRFAVGGSRRQVIQVVAIESLVLTLTACFVVTLIARWVFPPVFAFLNNDDVVNYDRTYWDWHSFAPILGLGIVACIAATTVPVLRLLGTDINSGLKDGGLSMGEGRRTGRVRNAFVVLQAAFAVILLTGTGLMVRSFDRLRHVDLGFDPVGRVKVWVIEQEGSRLKPEEHLALFGRLKERVGQLPGVRGVSFGQDSILSGGFFGGPELKMADGTFRPVVSNFVSEDYQKTVGFVMKRGRWLSGVKGVNEIVVNETLAKTRFPDRDPIGEMVQMKDSDRPSPIVGVVKDIRQNMRSSAGMMVFWPASNFPENVQSLVLRMDQDPKKEFSALVRRAVYQVDPNLVVSWVTSIDQQVTDSMWYENYALGVLKGLAAIALGLTGVGIFSVIAYTVDSRMTEFGVRLALGATPSELNSLVMRRGIAATAVGVAVGLAGAAALTQFMKSMLYETTSYDPLVYAGVALILLLAAGAACWVPARRAARTDVMRLLKSE